MTRGGTAAHKWARIAEILRAPPEKARELRGSLDWMREYAQHWPALTAERRRKAVADLKAVCGALAALEGPLARLMVDAAPRVGRHESQTALLRPWGELPPAPSLALAAILAAIPEEERALLRKDYLSGALHFADDSDVQRLADGARRLRALAESALLLLGRNGRGASNKQAFEELAVGSIARHYSEATGKPMSSAKEGEFVELVSLVLGISRTRASALTLAARRPRVMRGSPTAAKRAKSAKTRASARAARG